MFMLDRSTQNEQEEPVSPKWQCNASPWLSVVPVKYALSDTFFLSWELIHLVVLRNVSYRKVVLVYKAPSRCFNKI